MISKDHYHQPPQTPPTVREVSRLLGKFNSVSQAVPPGPLFCRAMQRDVAKALDLSNHAPCHLSPEAGLVEQSLDSLEWEEPGIETTRSSNRIGCIPHRMGSIMSGHTDRRSLVPTGEESPHKLPRATSSYTSSENHPKESWRQESTTATRQYDSSSICEQFGRDSLRPCHRIGERFMDVVSAEGHTADSTTFTREGECDSGQGVESDERSLRLDAQPADFPPSPRTFPLPGNRSVCNTIDTRFFSWRPEPLAEATDAFLQDWSLVKGYANPPWNLIGRALAKVESQGADLILIAPIWLSQPWYPRLLSLLVAKPLKIDPQRVVITEDQLDLTPPLAVWPISGNTTKVKNFQMKLQTSSYCHGDRRPHSPMTHLVRSGLAGALRGSAIQQDL